MNLIAFSIKTKGVHNFARRLWTVFSRFGISESRTRNALFSIIDALSEHNAAPTFFIPATVLRRHVPLITDVARSGTELGIHGYVHNDYRLLGMKEQYQQTQQAISLFKRVHIPFSGFRNPYLGWTQDSLDVFAALKLAYESNEAVLHEVVDVNTLSPLIRSGYEKSLALFQAIVCNAYTVRPHFEGELLRIPTSIPDDEMLFDRLRITNAKEVGDIWSQVMHRVYDLGGLYTLNLHPERGVLCREALMTLLSYAHNTLQNVWIARLQDIAEWWKERRTFSFSITSAGEQRWHVEAKCSSRTTILARALSVGDVTTSTWSAREVGIEATSFVVQSTHIPCIGLSPETSDTVIDFLQEQGYAYMRCEPDKAACYPLYLDLPEGLGTSRAEQIGQRSKLIAKIEQAVTPLLRFACWPQGHRAALSVSGDIDSVTIQDFFLRILEVVK